MFHRYILKQNKHERNSKNRTKSLFFAVLSEIFVIMDKILQIRIIIIN